MGLLAVFGITNDGLNLAVNLLLLFLVVFWIALIYWTYADARRRIPDAMLVGCATAASVFPFLGTIVYLIVRPPEYIEDVRERELEIAAAEARLHSLHVLACPYCDYEVERSFLRCPNCMRRLKEPCATCGKPLDPRWKICPYCEAEVGQTAQPEQRPRQRRAQAGGGGGGGGGGAPPRQSRPQTGSQRPAGSQRQSSGDQPPTGQRAAGQRQAPKRQPRPEEDGGTRDQPAARRGRPRPSASG
jgi:Double zinc ribbon